MRGKTKNTARAIGEKLRAAREGEQISLRALAAKANMSASMLSQIENGKAFPSVRSMYDIASALNLPVDYFFPAHPTDTDAVTASEQRTAQLQDAALAAQDANTPSPIVARAQRPTLALNGGVTWARLTAQAEAGAEFLEITYDAGATSGAQMSHHVGREFGLVLEGELIVELGFEKYILKQGDSIIFDSTTPHRLSNGCATPMRALWVVLNAYQTPPYRLENLSEMPRAEITAPHSNKLPPPIHNQRLPRNKVARARRQK